MNSDVFALQTGTAEYPGAPKNTSVAGDRSVQRQHQQMLTGQKESNTLPIHQLIPLCFRRLKHIPSLIDAGHTVPIISSRASRFNAWLGFLRWIMADRASRRCSKLSLAFDASHSRTVIDYYRSGTGFRKFSSKENARLPSGVDNSRDNRTVIP